MQKIFLLVGTIFGALGIGIGAFGAHALKKILLENQRLDVFETAVKYQFYHCFALLFLGLLLFRFNNEMLNWAGYLFIAGTIIFSGSLYILSLSNIAKWGAVTPIGGVLMILGWILLFSGILKGYKI